MPKKSAGILIYREKGSGIEVFLVHPGGPFWAGKEEGAWSIPKGEFSEGEDHFEAARRELYEETGVKISGNFQPLKPVKQPSGKVVYAWAIRGDANPAAIKSNMFSIKWPRGSGEIQHFPEVDRASWFELEEAMHKILRGQSPLLNQLKQLVTRDVKYEEGHK